MKKLFSILVLLVLFGGLVSAHYGYEVNYKYDYDDFYKKKYWGYSNDWGHGYYGWDYMGHGYDRDYKYKNKRIYLEYNPYKEDYVEKECYRWAPRGKLFYRTCD